MARREHGGRVEGAIGRRLGRPSSDEGEEPVGRTDELNRNAELYWQSLTREPGGREHLLRKPFSNPSDAAGICYRLGLALDQLQLGVGHTVLDLGCGTGWLSVFLHRLGCHTISVDVSPTALELGEQLLHSDPLRRSELAASFVPYDGHQIPLPDRAVDRVICFDAFHHVPNQREILSEVHRVLADGGRAVFAEPGKGHASEARSQYESQRYGVLEADLDFEELCQLAAEVGFDRVLAKPYPDVSVLVMEGAEFLRLLGGEDGVFPLEKVRENLEHFYIFALQKGEMVRDSRNPGRLEARITVRAPTEPLRYAAGTQVALRASVENRGDTLWLARPVPTGGFVSLGGRLWRADSKLRPQGAYSRAALPRDVAPGERIDVEFEFTAPGEDGRYTLELDLVDEGLAWFAESGSRTRTLDLVVEGVTDSRHPGILRAQIETSQNVWVAEGPGELLSIPVRIRNRGNTTWLAEAETNEAVVRLGGQLSAAGCDGPLRDVLRIQLERSVEPAGSVDLECQLRAPAVAGRYLLRLDLLIENRCWFHERGSVPLDVTLEVAQRLIDSTNPSQLLARLELLTKARSFSVRPGAHVEIPVRIENVGDTIWRHQPDPGGGFVALGGHLVGPANELLEVDFLRVPLPCDVAPGEATEVTCRFRAPEQACRQRVELDLVDEGIAWFADHGSRTLVIEVDTTGP